MVTLHLEESYQLTEVTIEQWLLAALRLNRGLALRANSRPRRRARPARLSAAVTHRRSLWGMLAVSLLGLVLL